MSILIASDIHGSEYYCSQLVDRIEEECPDHILLLGDLLYHGPRNPLPKDYDPQAVATLLNTYAHSIVAVRGNCDSEVDQMLLDFPCMGDYTTILLKNKASLFATHGHLWDPDNLPSLKFGTVFCYGHTHIKQLERINDTLIVNPGSVSIPKDGTHSYAFIKKSSISLKNLLTGDLIVSCNL